MRIEALVKLPFGGILNLCSFQALVFCPLFKQDADLPNGYIHFNDGTPPLSICAGDAWMLQEHLSGLLKQEQIIPVSDSYKERIKLIEARQQREREENERRKLEEKDKHGK